MNKAFEEFVMKRCEEILTNDETYQKFNHTILDMESKFKKTLSQEQIKDYNKLEETVMASITYATAYIYNKCLEDIIKSAPKS